MPSRSTEHGLMASVSVACSALFLSGCFLVGYDGQASVDAGLLSATPDASADSRTGAADDAALALDASARDGAADGSAAQDAARDALTEGGDGDAADPPRDAASGFVDAALPEDAGPTDGRAPSHDAAMGDAGGDAAVWWSGVPPTTVCTSLLSCGPSCAAGGLGCVLDCGGTTMCSPTCANGSQCHADCGNATTCNVSCQPGSRCSVECSATLANTCSTACALGASCAIDCTGSTLCSAHCLSGSTCDIDCAGAVSCTQLTCDQGASCLVQCANAATCNVSCGGSSMSCPGGVLTCDRACP